MHYVNDRCIVVRKKKESASAPGKPVPRSSGGTSESRKEFVFGMLLKEDAREVVRQQSDAPTGVQGTDDIESLLTGSRFVSRKRPLEKRIQFRERPPCVGKPIRNHENHVEPAVQRKALANYADITDQRQLRSLKEKRDVGAY